ncbi:MAG: hypothetical protein MOIL_00965 [Candidatus Methanolliviera sp. GoM_oil]|nr:MAG: hypothetical protein MOIL_00965 [Candidatus Methanolliviera sp. GoM_oil]
MLNISGLPKKPWFLCIDYSLKMFYPKFCPTKNKLRFARSSAMIGEKKVEYADIIKKD